MPSLLSSGFYTHDAVPSFKRNAKNILRGFRSFPFSHRAGGMGSRDSDTVVICLPPHKKAKEKEGTDEANIRSAHETSLIVQNGILRIFLILPTVFFTN